MIVTPKDVKKLKGQILRFSYPRHGYGSDCRCMEERCVRVDRVQRQGSSALITGHDFSRGQECNFMLSEMEDIHVDEEWSDSRMGYTIVVADKEGLETLSKDVDREDADGIAFGFNSRASAAGHTVRAAVLLDHDLM